MPVLLSNHTNFHLDDIQVSPLTLTVQQGQQQVSLQQKPMEVLCYLAAHYPALVTREQLIDAVWDGNIYVGEKALTNAIWQLRQLFSQWGQPDLIMTVRKKGYRLQQAPSYNNTLPANDLTVAGNAMATPALSLRPPRRWPLVVGLALFGIILLVWWQIAQPPPNQLAQITQLQGWAQHPAVTPDGRWLVYSWQQFGHTSDLYLLDLQKPTAPHRQLTFSADDELRPEISANGQQVYFSSRHPEDGRCQIKRLDISTLQESLLAECGRHNDVYLDLSPDQQTLYFNGSRGNKASGLYRLDLQQNLPPQELPCVQHCNQRVRDIAVSPDGQSLAITRRANRLAEEIYSYDLATATERQLTKGHADIRGLSFTANSQQILFSADLHGRNQGYLLDIAQEKVQPMPIDDVSFVSKVTNDGAVFFHRDSSVSQLGYLPLQQPSAIFPLSAGDVSFQTPSFHSSTARLLYLSDESGHTALWTADASMQQKKQLSQMAAVLKYPQWSPSGQQVLMLSRTSDTTSDRLTLLDVATGKLQFVDSGIALHGRPAWAHNDSALLLPSNDAIWWFDLTSGRKHQVSRVAANAIQMIDSSGFYFSKGRGKGLWWQALAAPLTGSEHSPVAPERLLDGEHFSESYPWVADNQHVYFLQPSAHGTELKRYQRDSGALTTLVVLPSEQLDLSTRLALDSTQQRLIVQYAPIPRIDIWRWQLP